MTKLAPSRAPNALDDVWKVMELFIANAKTYVQLSGSALLLTVSFARLVLGVPEGQRLPLNWSLVATWISFLVATLAGVTYQYLAVRFLESHAGTPIHHERFDWPTPVKENPWVIYALMMAAFYAGAVLFTVTAVGGVWRH